MLKLAFVQFVKLDVQTQSVDDDFDVTLGKKSTCTDVTHICSSSRYVNTNLQSKSTAVLLFYKENVALKITN